MAMRSFIDIVGRDLIEAKMAGDGVWTQVSSQDLQRLAATKHLRGFAAHDEVFLWDAYDETHFGMLGAIGIDEEEAIPFFVRSPSPALDGSHGGDNPPEDWNDARVIRVGAVKVQVPAEQTRKIKRNKGFRLMIGSNAADVQSASDA